VKLPKYWIMSLALAALALAAAIPRAAAGQIFKGTFSLSSTAYWGDTLLQPGEYTIKMDSDLTKTPVIRVRGDGVNVAVMAIPVSGQPLSSHSSLTLREFNGGFAVQGLDAGPLGETFHFGISKNARRTMESATATKPVHIPVSTGNGN
jgi:hypothetical protein